MMFAAPWYFLLLLLIPLIVWLYVYRSKRRATFTISTTKGLDQGARTWFSRLSWLPKVLSLLAYLFAVIALARPQTSDVSTTSSTEGINIVLAMDVSSSMLAQDLTPNRLEAAKSVAAEFISSRPTDNIGLVLFARESFTQCPLTTDRATLLNLLDGVEIGLITDGTAIGNGLATAVGRLKDVEGPSKVVILLTDGSNNSGEIAPQTAADIAQTFGVRVYTIGVGSKGTAPYPFQTPMGIVYQDVPVEIDEGILESISQKTGGQYFRATDNDSLKQIYKEIDQMEKTKISVETFSKKKEHFVPFVMVAFLLLLLSLGLRLGLFRQLP